MKNEKLPMAFATYRQALNLLKCLWPRPAFKASCAFALAVFASLVAGVACEFWMNRWQGSFFSAIEHRDYAALWTQSYVFLLIAAATLPAVVGSYWLLEQTRIRFRRALTEHFLAEWLMPGRPFNLRDQINIDMNPGQRIQDDVRSLTELSGELGLGAMRSFLLVIVFSGVLWKLSAGITLPVVDQHIPGFMFWAAILYAGAGIIVATKVGSALLGLNEKRYMLEGEFRHGLQRVHDHAESIAFYGGEKAEGENSRARLNLLLGLFNQISFAFARLTWVTSGHGLLALFVPLLLALPGYLQGRLDFGGLMMVIGAFNQMQGALRWFVDNYYRIADWRSVVERVSRYNALLAQETDEPEIELVPNLASETALTIDSLDVRLMDGRTIVHDACAQIKSGDRVLLSGPSGAGKSMILRALCGLWRRGGGKIFGPALGSASFIPQRPYIPVLALKDAIMYPHKNLLSDDKFVECLRAVNLPELIPMLGSVQKWDAILSLGQQQRLGFARILLHKPKWIFLDEATSALDPKNEALMMSLLRDRLPNASWISVAHRPSLRKFHTTALNLKPTDDGSVLSSCAIVTA